MIVGLNFPPSQYQLHLQFMLPPLMPFHWKLYKEGVHFTPGRFFPLAHTLRNTRHLRPFLKLIIRKKFPQKLKVIVGVRAPNVSCTTGSSTFVPR